MPSVSKQPLQMLAHLTLLLSVYIGIPEGHLDNCTDDALIAKDIGVSMLQTPLPRPAHAHWQLSGSAPQGPTLNTLPTCL